jgi:hypothetical protein
VPLAVHFELLDDHQAVAARVTGGVDLARCLKIVGELVQLGRRHGWKDFLLDLRQADRPLSRAPVIRVYESIRQLSTLTGLHHADRLAVLLNPANFDEQRLDFWTTIRSNWGAPTFQFFLVEEDALGWLRTPTGQEAH